MDLLILRVCSRFSAVSLEHVQARAVHQPPPTPTVEQEQAAMLDPESLLPRYPLELQHSDLSSLLVRWEEVLNPRWPTENPPPAIVELAVRSYKRTHPEMDEGTIREMAIQPVPVDMQIQAGEVQLSFVYPMRLTTPTCFDCERPLGLYTLSSQQETPLFRGQCPACLLRSAWRREASIEELLCHKDGRRFNSSWLSQREKDYLSEWRRSDQDWWEEERRLQTPTYCRWRERALARINPSFTTESSLDG